MATVSSEKLCKICAKFIRLVYIGVATYYVCYGYYTTILMAREANLMVKEEVTVLKKYRYPSLTFCYIYKHGFMGMMDDITSDMIKLLQRHARYRRQTKDRPMIQKDFGGKNVWWVYHRHFNEKWKKAGNERNSRS